MLSVRITFVVTALLTLYALQQAFARQPQEPWFGTWKLNLAKSTTDREARYKRATTKIEPWRDGLKVTYDLVGTRGGITHMEWTGRFDGNDYPVQGVDYVLTHAYRRVNDRAYQITIKIDGVVAAIARVEVSPDSQTLTTLTTGKDAQGRTVSTTAVYERQ
jgi:hypothetical protein